MAVAWVVGWGWLSRHDAPDHPGMSRPAVTLAPPARPSAPATLTRSLLATWNPAYSALDAGSLSVGQRLELQKGLAEITFASGAKLTLQAPMSLIITTSNAARLEAGQLTAEVPPAAAGFTLDVPTGKIIDRGTRFGVIVEKAPEATGGEIVEVHVLKGNVEVETEAQPGAVPSVTQLDVNQAVRSDTATRSLQRIPAEPARFISSINEPITLQSGDILVDGPERTIRRVSDGAIFAAGINPRSDIKDLAFSADGAALYTIENRWKGSFGPTSKLIRIDVLDPGHPKEATRFRHWGIRLAGSADGTLLACDLEPPKKNTIVVRLDPKQNYRRTTLGELPGTCNGLAVSPAGEIYAAVAQHFVARVDHLLGELTPVVSDIDPGSLAIDPANGDLLVGVALPAGSMEIRRYRPADQFRPVGNPLLLTEKMTLLTVTVRGMFLATPVQGSGLWEIDPRSGERTLIYPGLVKALAIYPSVK
ncbi:MAG: FecR family protein [Planctomycetes bacterium]|nr:FecR family protein [Planctomycetota bacterium]